MQVRILSGVPALSFNRFGFSFDEFCRCGHRMTAHDCSDDFPDGHCLVCRCEIPKPVDWVTDFCKIPESITEYQFNVPLCECGHDSSRHCGYDKRWNRVSCLGPWDGKTSCGCSEFIPMDWITDFCKIPSSINTSISNLENSYDQESPLSRD